nr:NADH dehydrogenase subunit 6 [Pleonosporium sp.]
MNWNYFLFIIFSINALTSALMVISLTNAVHSVLFLVLTFCNMTFLLLLLGAEFFSFLLIIVYVGAIAVLFLFVIMMLNVKDTQTNHGNLLYLAPLSGIFILFFVDYFYKFTLHFTQVNLNFLSLNLWFNETDYLSNTVTIGKILYTHFGLLFIIAGLILLIAMVGVISLTMHQKINVKQQQIEVQLVRNPKNSLKFLKIRY